MSKFTSNRRLVVSVNTSALPDIVFMLLFFFMVVTVFRDQQLLLRIDLPQADRAQKLQHRSLINEIYIGIPRDKVLGQHPVIQINDAFVRIEQVQGAVKSLVAQVPEYQRAQMKTSLKVDQRVEMGIVTDVKTELRKAEQYQINYVALPTY